MAICLVLTVVLTLLSKVPLAVAQGRAKGGYDNETPRQQQATLSGWGQRAWAAHQNAWEALLLQGLGLLAVIASGEDSPEIGGSTEVIWLMAIGWMVCRVGYTALYVAGLGSFRSVVWTLGFLCSLGLMVMAIPGVGNR